jgi:hypothetical protein
VAYVILDVVGQLRDAHAKSRKEFGIADSAFEHPRVLEAHENADLPFGMSSLDIVRRADDCHDVGIGSLDIQPIGDRIKAVERAAPEFQRIRDATKPALTELFKYLPPEIAALQSVDQHIRIVSSSKLCSPLKIEGFIRGS